MNHHDALTFAEFAPALVASVGVVAFLLGVRVGTAIAALPRTTDEADDPDRRESLPATLPVPSLAARDHYADGDADEEMESWLRLEHLWN